MRRPRWERLEALLVQARGGRRRLGATELEELGRLYRQSTSDLAIARRDFPGDRVTRYLEQLVGRTHPVVYRADVAPIAALGRFYAHGFPRLFRDSWRYTVVAFALIFLPFVIALIATLNEPLNGRMILSGRDFVEQVERGQTWLEIDGPMRSVVAAGIMTNNIQVTFLALGGGVLLGLGTVYVLVYNGLHLGAITGLAITYGLGPDIGTFVAGHGGIELSVVFIAGGAGLRLGHALLAPGLYSRRIALAQAGQISMRLMFGCVPLLVVAGLIEGFISPSALPLAAKLAVGAGSTALLYGYLLWPRLQSGTGKGGMWTSAIPRD